MTKQIKKDTEQMFQDICNRFKVDITFKDMTDFVESIKKELKKINPKLVEKIDKQNLTFSLFTLVYYIKVNMMLSDRIEWHLKEDEKELIKKLIGK